LRQLSRQSLFGDRERLDAGNDQALVELGNLLGLDKPPRRIEGFDISHMAGTDNVASMVVFVNGVPDKTAYRKFKMIVGGNDDTAHMAETIRRRLRDENRRKWGTADLILIDGGKGQLSAAMAARDQAGCANIPMIGLAKRFEDIILKKPTIPQNPHFQGASLESEEFRVVRLPSNSPAVKLLQRIRDESHRFATAYHSTLQRRRQTASILDEIPAVGPVTRKKLVRKFGSLRAATRATEAELQAALGRQKGALLARYLTARQQT